ncbi:MAG: hypothetical protein WEB30_16080 [Cyclobacteriaceae bacterium]
MIILTAGLPPAVTFAFGRGWLPGVPGFLFETTWLVAFVTTVMFIYLYRSRSTSYFVRLYMFSIAVKLLMYFAYCLIMILKDRPGSAVNVLYFLALYFIFTAVEIAFLYRRISRAERP